MNLWDYHPAVPTGSELKFRDRAVDAVRNGMGSLKFIFIQTVIIAAWMYLNTVAWCHHWDPAPWILLNLVFSIQAAYSSPLILISQKRADQIASEVARHTLENTDATQELLRRNTELTQQIHALLHQEQGGK